MIMNETGNVQMASRTRDVLEGRVVGLKHSFAFSIFPTYTNTILSFSIHTFIGSVEAS